MDNFYSIARHLGQTKAVLVSVGAGNVVYAASIYFMKIDIFDLIAEAMKKRLKS